MAVVSIRLNSEEEKIVDYLSSYFDEDKSTLIKHSLKEMYEDIVDREVIEEYESSETKKKPKFRTSIEILKEISVQ